ncbi:hypothetical protein FEM48_Zijuj04G0050600 [Ziziphus jujuba var. spinosa]|uniref:BAG family molecular chaperone regulator 8, chloroplastic n=1 Tax=Ziziphus jujuba var. spinosa TaxID=714518 RepID=A0A978VHY5_ZIZJJ|nr:hypothetical protein FEM48_Zijuj04G0050600 [Ziziphus jujuba var. spinosa]
MASNHHHLHHHQSHPPSNYCCNSSCCLSCTSNHGCSNQWSQSHCNPPPPQPTDPLLQAVASHLLQSNTNHSYPRLYTKKHTQFHHLKHRLHGEASLSSQQQQQQTHSIISSLLSRIEALEASLFQFSSSFRSHSSSYPPHSLQDLAARVIQTHFRAFLVRRSRSLRQLKDLALIKSAFNSLKSSFSNETHFDFRAISRNAMDLLLELDSIQGDDPMIRDGKKSITRDLVRFLEFMDGVAVKRNGLSLKAMKKERFGRNGDKSRGFLGSECDDLDGDQRAIIGKLRDRVKRIHGFSKVSENNEEHVELEGFQHFSNDDEDEENPRVVISGKNGRIIDGVLVKRHGVQPRVKKSVSFAEDGNVLKVFSNTHDSISNGDGTSLDDSVSSDDQVGDFEEKNCSEVEEIKSPSQGIEDDEEAHMEKGEFSQASDGEIKPRTTRIPRRESRGYCQDNNSDFVFSPPLPVQMETKADLMRGRMQRNKMF